jgi:hypothetical protein
MREPQVGDWVCCLDADETGTALGAIEYIINKGAAGIVIGASTDNTERQYVTHSRVLRIEDILEVRGEEKP